MSILSFPFKNKKMSPFFKKKSFRSNTNHSIHDRVIEKCWKFPKVRLCAPQGLIQPGTRKRSIFAHHFFPNSTNSRRLPLYLPSIIKDKSLTKNGIKAIPVGGTGLSSQDLHASQGHFQEASEYEIRK